MGGYIGAGRANVRSRHQDLHASGLHRIHRELIIERARRRVVLRTAPRPTEVEIVHGIPLFLDQLRARLRAVSETGAVQIGASAALHGSELSRTGFTIGQVVHDYGDVCQAICDLAIEQGSAIPTDDFQTLNLCLDIAIAEAVTEFARQREEAIIGQGVEHLGCLAHELRNLLNKATLALEVLRAGTVGTGGSTGAILQRSLEQMRDLVNRSLAEVRLEAGPPRHERVLVADLLEEIEIAIAAQARERDIHLSIDPAEPGLAVHADSQILASIVTNLMQNACKFSRPHGWVVLRVAATSERILIEVSDECGGLPPGKAAELFQPYEQRGDDRSGLGLGLPISMKGARALGGELSVRDVPGTGCVFTLAMPRAAPADPPSPP